MLCWFELFECDRNNHSYEHIEVQRIGKQPASRKATETQSLYFFSASLHRASQVVLMVKHPPASEEDVKDEGSIPLLGRSPGEGNGYPFQYSWLDSVMDRGTWWATVHGVTKSRTWLKWISTQAHGSTVSQGPILSHCQSTWKVYFPSKPPTFTFPSM